jgi:hypothetical protein
MLTKSGISRRIFIKFSNTKIHVNPSSATRREAEGPTDREKERHVEGNRRFPRIYDELYKRLAVRTYGNEYDSVVLHRQGVLLVEEDGNVS